MAIIATIRAQIHERMGAWFTKGLAVLVLAAIFFVALGGVSHSERWRIDTINVSGAVIVPTTEVQTFVQGKLLGNYLLVYARDNSLLFPKQEIERGLISQFPRLESAVVKTVGIHALSVVVTERKPYALWCGEQYNPEPHELPSCWFIDDEGFIFDRAPIISEGVYLEVYGAINKKSADSPMGGMLPETRFAKADHVEEMLRARVGEVLRIVLKPENELDIIMHTSTQYPVLSGVALRLKDEIVPLVAVDNLIAAMKEEFPVGIARSKKLQYIDMRFGNKIFFGFAN